VYVVGRTILLPVSVLSAREVSRCQQPFFVLFSSSSSSSSSSCSLPRRGRLALVVESRHHRRRRRRRRRRQRPSPRENGFSSGYTKEEELVVWCSSSILYQWRCWCTVKSWIGGSWAAVFLSPSILEKIYPFQLPRGQRKRLPLILPGGHKTCGFYVFSVASLGNFFFSKKKYVRSHHQSPQVDADPFVEINDLFD